MYEICEGRLVYRYERERVWVEARGADGIRVRGAKDGVLRENAAGALEDRPAEPAEIEIHEGGASLRNGGITARFEGPRLTFTNARGEELTGELWQGSPLGRPSPIHDPLIYPGRV